MTYCEAAKGHPYHGPYHDHEYGYPLSSDDELFERLVLEINQAGLSWLTILKKRDSFRRAYHGFDVHRVANYADADRARLLRDAGVIRNRLKIDAAIHNARAIQRLRAEHGGFAAWLDAYHPRTKEEWLRVFRPVFKFVGGEIVSEFLLSTGYLAGAHTPDCHVYERIIALDPPWRRGWLKSRTSESRRGR
jgi:DNA-3-methyladenine glycosylase I